MVHSDFRFAWNVTTLNVHIWEYKTLHLNRFKLDDVSESFMWSWTEYDNKLRCKMAQRAVGTRQEKDLVFITCPHPHHFFYNRLPTSETAAVAMEASRSCCTTVLLAVITLRSRAYFPPFILIGFNLFSPKRLLILTQPGPESPGVHGQPWNINYQPNQRCNQNLQKKKKQLKTFLGFTQVYGWHAAHFESPHNSRSVKQKHVYGSLSHLRLIYGSWTDRWPRIGFISSHRICSSADHWPPNPIYLIG